MLDGKRRQSPHENGDGWKRSAIAPRCQQAGTTSNSSNKGNHRSNSNEAMLLYKIETTTDCAMFLFSCSDEFVGPILSTDRDIASFEIFVNDRWPPCQGRPSARAQEVASSLEDDQWGFRSDT